MNHERIPEKMLELQMVDQQSVGLTRLRLTQIEKDTMETEYIQKKHEKKNEINGGNFVKTSKISIFYRY